MYTLAYVTCQDICSIRAFQEQIVIAIKAPEETKLEIPIPKEVSFIHFSLRGTKGLKFDFCSSNLIEFQFLCHV